MLVQEFVPNGDLLALMQSHGGRVDETTVVKVVMRPLLGALMYLHRWGIVHRDVKVGSAVIYAIPPPPCFPILPYPSLPSHSMP